MSGSIWSKSDCNPSVNRHREIVKTYYQNLEYTYPERVTSRRMCPCLDYANECSHPLEGKAEYLEYRGPPVQKL